MNHLVVAISLTYLTAIIGPGASLKCYQCYTNATEEICKDPFYKNDSLLIDCKTTDAGCAKIDYIVPAVSAEAFKTSRGCVSYSDLKKLEAAQPIIGIIEFCDIDGCNGSVTLQSSAAVMIFTAVARCLYYGFR